MRIKLDTETIRYINLFESMTGAIVKDCIVDDKKNKILFVIGEGQAGIAIGKNGSNVKKIGKMLNKQIEVLEFSDDPVKFVVNVFRPIKVKEAYVSEKSDGQKVIYISLSDDKIGMIRSKMKIVKNLMDKYFGIKEIVYR